MLFVGSFVSHTIIFRFGSPRALCLSTCGQSKWMVFFPFIPFFLFVFFVLSIVALCCWALFTTFCSTTVLRLYRNEIGENARCVLCDGQNRTVAMCMPAVASAIPRNSNGKCTLMGEMECVSTTKKVLLAVLKKSWMEKVSESLNAMERVAKARARV